VADTYSLEQLTADLASARAEKAIDLTPAEVEWIRDAAWENANAGPEDSLTDPRHAYVATLQDLAVTTVGHQANERWRRKRALARGDSLAACWPEIAGRSDG
jgi:hypothetical protein